MVDQNVQFRNRPHPRRWARRSRTSHRHQRVSTTLAVGAPQVGDGDVALTETFHGLGPVGLELGLAVMGPHLAELGAAQVIESGPQLPTAGVGFGHGGGSLVAESLGGVGRAIGVDECLPAQRPPFELLIRQGHRVVEQVGLAGRQGIVGDAGVGGDLGNQRGLLDAHLTRRERLEPQPQPGLHTSHLATMERFALRQLQPMCEKGLAGEEPVTTERIGGHDPLRHRHRSRLGSTPHLLHTDRQPFQRRSIELCVLIDHQLLDRADCRTDGLVDQI